MNHRTASLLAALLMALFLPAAAFAACTGPAGNAGDYINNGDNYVLQYCNGTNWIAMGHSGGTSSAFSLVANDSTRGVSKVWGDGTYIYFDDYYSHFFGAYTFTGGVLTLVGSYTDANAEYNSVWGDGTYIYVTDTYNDSIEAFTFNGSTFTLKGSYAFPANPMGVWGHGGYIYVADTSTAYALTFNGTTFTVAGSYSIGDTDLRVVWGDGTYIYFGDAYNSNEIYAFTFNGTTFTLKGTDSYNTGADDFPVPLSLWGNGGYIYDADNNGYIRAYTFNGTTFALAGSYSVPNAASVWGDGTYIYVGSNSNSTIYAFTFNGSTFTLKSSLITPSAVYGIWGDGTYIYAADYANGVDVFHFAVGGRGCGTVSSTGLVAWWKLGESTATDAVDSSGNGNTMTAVTAYSETPGTVVSGKWGNARSLDNSGNDSLQLGASGVEASSVGASLQGMTQFTASIWVNTTSFNSTNQTFILGIDNYPNYGFEIIDNGSYAAVVMFVIYNGSGHDLTIPRASVNDGNWHLLTGTYDGTTQSFYLDGVLQGSQAAGYVDGPFVPNDGPGIGGISPGSMILHDARIYNRALSAAEVSGLAHPPAGKEGDMMYNNDYHVMQFCDGASWQPMGYTGAGGSGCTGPAGNEADMFYNGTHNVMEYCNGASWIPIGYW